MDSNRRASEVHLLKMASQVMMVCNATLEVIVGDLRITNDPHLTISRILDGQIQQPQRKSSPAPNRDARQGLRQERWREPRAEPQLEPLPPTPSKKPAPADIVVLLSSSEDEIVVKKEKLQPRPSPRRSRPPQTERRPIDPFVDDDALWNDSYELAPPPPPPPPLDIKALMRDASMSPGPREIVTKSPLRRATTSRNLHASPSLVSSSSSSTNKSPISKTPTSSAQVGGSYERASSSRFDAPGERPKISKAYNQFDPFDDWDYDLDVSPVSFRQVMPEMDDSPVVIFSPKESQASRVSSSSSRTPTTARVEVPLATPRTRVATPPSASATTATTSLRRGTSNSTHSGSTSSTNNGTGLAITDTAGLPAPLPRKLFGDHCNDVDTPYLSRTPSASRIGSKPSVSLQLDAFDDGDDYHHDYQHHDEGVELWNDEDQDDVHHDYRYLSHSTTAKSPAKKTTTPVGRTTAATSSARASSTTTTTTTIAGSKRKRGRPSKQDTITASREGAFDMDSLREWEDVSPSLDSHHSSGAGSRTSTGISHSSSVGGGISSRGQKMRSMGIDQQSAVEILDDDDGVDDDGNDSSLDVGLSFEELLVRDSKELIGDHTTLDHPPSPQPRRRTTRRTGAAARDTGSTRGKGAGRREGSEAKDGDGDYDHDDDDEGSERNGSGSDYEGRPRRTTTSKRSAAAAAKRAAAAEERAAIKAQKEKEKQERKRQAEDERERKRMLQQEQREQREREKMAREAEKEEERRAIREIRIANRLSTKSESARELILCVERELFHSEFGKVLKHHLEPLGLQVETLKVKSESSHASSVSRFGANGREDIQSLGTCDLKDMMFWKRGVTQRYDEAQEQFVPIGATEIEMEPFILLYLRAADFATQVKDNMLQLNLEVARRQIRRMCNMELMSMSNPSANWGDLAAKREQIRVWYVIQGMDAYIRGLRRVITKNFQAAVLAKIQPNSGSTSGADTTTTSDAAYSQSAEAKAEQEQIEAELLRLQVHERCSITHVVDDEEASEEIVALTEQIGYAPYKPKIMTNVCMDGIRSGQNAADTWIRALQEISMVTPQVAKSIAAEYPTMRMLYEGYRICRTISDAEGMLADIAILGKTRVIGRVISKRVYDVFMGQDPNKVVS
ncbi:hypothetical protein DFQ26_003886 [Actinomortierella ambigua]|nr:hypothetical protein DFQ26_003886 [Actinomortierella ambigua]